MNEASWSEASEADRTPVSSSEELINRIEQEAYGSKQLDPTAKDKSSINLAKSKNRN